MRAALAALFLALLGTAAADTVVLRSGEKVVGKVIRYGDFVIVASDPAHVRILDPILIDLTIESPSKLECFLDLPPAGEDAPDPDPSRVHVYGSAKAKARDLLGLATRRGVPADKATRAREALKAMGSAAEEELLSAIRPDGDQEKVVLALACLEKSQPKDLEKDLEKRLVETALHSDQETLCRLAAEELKRRLGKTPPDVMTCLTNPETGWKPTRAAADVVGVIRDKGGIQALAQAIRTRGVRTLKGPRIPFVTGFTQVDHPGGMVARNKDGGLSLTRISWMDEEFQLKEPEERILYHLLGVLKEITDRDFKNLEEVEDWAAGAGP